MTKKIYKLELLCVKFIPVLISISLVLEPILYQYHIEIEWLNYISGTSILTVIPMYISSIAYKFCEYYRLFIHYILIHKVVSIIDYQFGIDVTDEQFTNISLILLGVVIILFMYQHLRYLHKNKKNVKDFKKVSTKNS